MGLLQHIVELKKHSVVDSHHHSVISHTLHQVFCLHAGPLSSSGTANAVCPLLPPCGQRGEQPGTEIGFRCCRCNTLVYLLPCRVSYKRYVAVLMSCRHDPRGCLLRRINAWVLLYCSEIIDVSHCFYVRI